MMRRWKSSWTLLSSRLWKTWRNCSCICTVLNPAGIQKTNVTNGLNKRSATLNIDRSVNLKKVIRRYLRNQHTQGADYPTHYAVYWHCASQTTPVHNQWVGTRYTKADIRLLAATDRLHCDLNGVAIKKICERAYQQGDPLWATRNDLGVSPIIWDDQLPTNGWEGIRTVLGQPRGRLVYGTSLTAGRLATFV